MKTIWSFIEAKNWLAEKKYRAVAVILTVISAAAGLAAGILFHFLFRSSMEWMLCFAGYPVAAAWVYLFFYSCMHRFHDGSHAS